jgi:transcription-repair coupling factor (superfamily II helicase)
VPTTILINSITAFTEDWYACFYWLFKLIQNGQTKKAETLKLLAEGKPILVIGTHQLVNKKCSLKDLDCWLLTKNRKFGVNVKDKLKNNSSQWTHWLWPQRWFREPCKAVNGSRDLSVILTPPIQ